jgi:hypothetical protein
MSPADGDLVQLEHGTDFLHVHYMQKFSTENEYAYDFDTIINCIEIVNRFADACNLWTFAYGTVPYHSYTDTARRHILFTADTISSGIR